MATAAQKAERGFAAAMAGRSFGGTATQKPAQRLATVPLPARERELCQGEILLGISDSGDPIALDVARLIGTRLLIQGTSGAGKSWTLRRILEQTAGLLPQIIVDPEGEFANLADELGMLRIDGHRLDIATLETAGARAREHRASILLDLSELDREGQMKAFTAFATALIEAPREHWHPCIVSIDEAHIFAPFGGASDASSVRKASVEAAADLMNRGRKRGLACVLATHRLARMSKSVASEALSVMIGHNLLDLDVRRAANAIGWDASRAFDRLPLLEAGNFVAVGAAFSRSPATLKVGAVRTPHRGSTPLLVPTRAVDRDKLAELIGLEALMATSAADDTARQEQARAPGLRQVRAFIREDAFPDAGRIWGALQKLVPNGARVSELAKHLSRKPDDIAAALQLLDTYGAIEFSGDGDKRAVRIGKGMLP